MAKIKKTYMTKEQLALKFGEASAVWQRLDSTKSMLKAQWEENAALTLPYLYPGDAYTEGVKLPTPYNSVGPVAVNNLANKLTLALLPPTGNFFRLMPYVDKVQNLTPEEYQQLDVEIRRVEQDINTLIAAQGLTTPIYDAVKLLIVTGNTLLYKVKNSTFKVYNPAHYCVERDYIGNVMSIIIKEEIDTRLLPAEFIKNEKKEGEKEEVESEEIYTCIYRVDEKNWVAYQEVDDQILTSTITRYPADAMPYIPLRWTNVHNEDYGRGLVEQYLGDLNSIEEITRGIIEGTSIASKVIFGVKPGKTTKADDLTSAENGGVITGDLESDVTTLQTNKSTDFNIAFKVMESLEARIGRAFLMFTSSVRDSERTTSAEIRATVNELDAAFGGTYAVLATELQRPVLRLLLSEVSPDAHKLTDPVIITGANAISREKDIQNLDYFFNRVAMLGPEVVAKYLKPEGYFKEFAIALGLEASKILRSDAEIAQINAQEQAMAQAEAGLVDQGAVPGDQQGPM